MIDGLLLLSKNDIPFISAELTVHVPTIKELGLIHEDVFWTAAQSLSITKDDVSGLTPEEAKLITNFDIFMKLMTDSSAGAKFNKACTESLLTLMFPEYRIIFYPKMLALTKEGENHIINEKNFDDLQEIVREIFCLNSLGGGRQQQQYDPLNKHAEMITQKILAGRKKLAEINAKQHNGQKMTILLRYISILSVGEQKDMNILLDYSVFQLFDEFQRFSLKEQSDFYLEAKMAGAKDLHEVDNWMKDIHSNSE